MSIQVGQKAPDFTLFSSEKEAVTLSSYTGKTVVLLFYPQAFTGTCTTELCTIRDNMAIYNNTAVDTLAISVDSVFTLAKFKDEQHFNFKLLSDFNKEVSRLYDVCIEEWIFGMKGVSNRAAFVIDGNGAVVYKEICASVGDLPSFENIQAAIETVASAS